MLVNYSAPQGELTQQAIDTLTQAGIIPSNTPKEQILVFAAICSERGLSPFSKEIYLVGYNNKYTPIIGINGLRKIAARTGLLAGCSDALYDLQSTGQYKMAADFKAGEKPNTCTVTVKKIVSGVVCDFTATVKFSEFTTNQQKWLTMPFQMIAKVAEAHAIRKAFSDVTTGLSVDEEVGAIYQDVTEKENPNLTKLKQAIADAQTRDELATIYKQNTALQSILLPLITERKKQIDNETV